MNALGSWDNGVTVTTVDDIGALTTKIVFAEPRIVDQVVYIAGDTIKKYRAVFAEGKGVAWDKSQTFNVRRSIAACGLEEWMRNNLLPSEGVALEDASHPE